MIISNNFLLTLQSNVKLIYFQEVNIEKLCKGVINKAREVYGELVSEAEAVATKFETLSKLSVKCDKVYNSGGFVSNNTIQILRRSKIA